MTVQAGTELSLELIVGDMPELACESERHATHKEIHDDGPATHYVQNLHPCLGPAGSVTARCAKVSMEIHLRRDQPAHCADCGQVGAVSDFMILLQPITK